MPIIASRLCPACSAASFRRSHRRGFLESGLGRLVGLKAYRCRSCRRRFLSWLDPSRPLRNGSANAAQRPIVAPPSPPDRDDLADYEHVVAALREQERAKRSRL